ncbi:MAG: hypothetical protein KME05_20490 [Gloeocapsa sp. UFS-A4-WI-NPMV-4B04]|nr:hypothetical protein [Gloeocapsa sp. UFS-A4-WI-NPMV-4B04]
MSSPRRLFVNSKGWLFSGYLWVLRVREGEGAIAEGSRYCSVICGCAIGPLLARVEFFQIWVRVRSPKRLWWRKGVVLIGLGQSLGTQEMVGGDRREALV